MSNDVKPKKIVADESDKELRELRKRAEHAYRTGALDQAEIAWTKLAESYPSEGIRASVFRARIALRQKREAEAELHYHAVVDRRPDHEEALRYVIRRLLANEKLEEAIGIREILRTKHPDSKAFIIADAFIAEATGQSDYANSILAEAVETWSDLPLFVQYVDTLRKADKLERALEVIDGASERFAVSPPLESRRAAILKSLISRNATSSDRCNALVDEVLAFRQFYSSRELAQISMACANAMNFDDAERLVEAAFRLSTDCELALQAQAHLEYRRKNYSEADKLWRIYGERNLAARSSSLLFRARIAASDSRPEDAAEHYAARVSEHGVDEEAYLFIIRRALAEERVDEARQLHRQMVAALPDNISTSAIAAEISCADGDIGAAIELLSSDLASSDPGLSLCLIDLLIQDQHDRKLTLVAIEKAIRVFPDDKRFLSRKISQIQIAIEEFARDGNSEAILSYCRDLESVGKDIGRSNLFHIVGTLIKAREFELAEKMLSHIKRMWGQDGASIHHLALICYRSGKYERADTLWETLAETDSARWRSATTHRARIALIEGRRADAANLFEDLWNRHPDHDEAAQFILRNLISADDNQGVQQLRNEIIQHQPDSKLLAYCDALVSSAAGNFSAAKKILREAVNKWPEGIELRLQLIDICRRAGHTQEALECIDETAELFPGDRRPADRKLGIISEIAGKEEVLELINAFLRATPDRVDLHIRKARILTNLGRRHEAVDACRRGLVYAPQTVELWRIGANSLLSLNEVQDASDFLDEALANFCSDTAVALIARAELLHAGERYSEAMEAVQLALAHAPTNSEATLILARSTEASGDWYTALKIYQNIGLEAQDRTRFASDLGRLAKAVSYVEGETSLPVYGGGRASFKDWARRVLQKLGLSKSISPRQYPHSIFETAVSRPSPNAYDAQPIVLHVTSSLGPGGAERQLTVNAIAQHKRAEGLDPHVAALSLSPIGRRDFFYAELENAGVEVTGLEDRLETGWVRNFIAMHPEHHEQISLLSALPADALRLAVPLYCEIVTKRPTVLHLWQDTTAVIGGLAGYLAGAPRMIFATRSTRPVERQRARPYLHAGFRALLSLPHAEMINNSRHGACDYEDWAGAQGYQVSTVYNGYDFEQIRGRSNEDEVLRIRDDLRCGDATLLLGGVMRLSAEKRPHLWLETAIALVKARSDVQAVLVGAGPMEPVLRKRIVDERLEDRIQLVGTKSPVEPWMTAMDLLLLSSETEGLPNVMIEAQALGTPVVATDVGGASETIIENQTGFLVPANESGDAIAANISRLFDDRERLGEMGQAGMEWVNRTFSITATLDSYEQLYRSIANAPASELEQKIRDR